jgi:hypothetical protein
VPTNTNAVLANMYVVFFLFFFNVFSLGLAVLTPINIKRGPGGHQTGRWHSGSSPPPFNKGAACMAPIDINAVPAAIEPHDTDDHDSISDQHDNNDK